jgi:DNA-binding Lrp family transcriptional regulator
VDISVLSRKILRELCTNSREPISEISGKFGISRYSTAERIQDLENALSLRYTLELNCDALGFSSIHIVAVKFSKKPEFDKLKLMLSKSRVVQLAVTTKGDFDLLIFAVAKGKVEYVQWETALQLALSKYGVAGNSYEVYMTRMGFLPLNNETIMASSIKDIYKK